MVVSHQTDSGITESSYFASGNTSTNNWRDINFLRDNLTIDHLGSDCIPYNLNFGQANYYQVDTNQSSGATVGNLDLFSGFEKNGEESKVNKSRLETLYRRSSSTRYDFLEPDNRKKGDSIVEPEIFDYILEPDNCFLTASSGVVTDTSDMGDGAEGSGVGKVPGDIGALGSDTGSDKDSVILSKDQLAKMMKKLDLLTNSMVELRSTVREQGEKIEKFESSRESGSESQSKSRPKGKLSRVELEKERQLKVLQDKLKLDRSRLDSTSSSSEKEVSADEGAGLKKIRKGLSRKQKKACDRKVEEVLAKAGAKFPIHEFESASSGKESSSTGVSSSRSRRHRRSRRSKVKSGAKVRVRPVVRTELWPHTVANEEDGEQATSENITLAKFMSSFTFITATCDKAESRGRAVLLHAVCLVLESLQWTEARIFHNLVMTKIEQGRINWDEDFSVLAEDFIDRKIRLGFRSRFASSAANSTSNRGYSTARSFRGSNQRGGYSRRKPMYGAVCYQWNAGTCSYGEECKRWHVCKTCADAGKLGEKHKASSHDTGGKSKKSG